MAHKLDPPLVAKNGRLLRILVPCRISDPTKQDERSLAAQRAKAEEWLCEHCQLPYELTVVEGRESGEWIEREDYLRLAVADHKFRLGPEPEPIVYRRMTDPLRFENTDSSPVGTSRTEDVMTALACLEVTGLTSLQTIRELVGLENTDGDKRLLQRALDKAGWDRSVRGKCTPPAR